MSDSREELRRAKVRTLRTQRERAADSQLSGYQGPRETIAPPSATAGEQLQAYQAAEQQNTWPLNRRKRLARRAALLPNAPEGNSGEPLDRNASEAGAKMTRESVAGASGNQGIPGNRGELGTMRPDDTKTRPNTEAALLYELLDRVRALTAEVVLLRADLIKQALVRREKSASSSIQTKRTHATITPREPRG